MSTFVARTIMLFTLCLVPVAALAQTIWDGTADTTWYTNNTSASSYTISTAEELAGLAVLVNGGNTFSGKTITLGNDIALNDTTGWQSWDENTTGLNSWTAIGTSYDISFRGTFDGDGYVIIGIYINTTASNQGMFGYTYNATIKNLGVEAFYIKGGSSVGGLVGSQSGGSVSNSYATGAVSGTSSVGGLVGSQSGGSVSNSYATGTVTGSSSYVGGLVGYGSTISNSYATGTVTGSSSYVGGLVGGSSGTISNSYYDSQTSGRSYDDYYGGDGKTTAEMQSKEFANILNIRASYLSMNAWIYSEGKYPALSNQTAQALNISDSFESGDGTLETPYIIKSKEQLKDFSLLVNVGISFSGEYINLGNDIALNDTTGWQNWANTSPANAWTAIGTYSTCPFRGTFDGDGYVVIGVYINTTSNYQGLFGYVGSGGIVKNLGVTTSYIKGGNYVGGLVGYISSGTVSNSYATGAVSGTSYVGGLVGYQSGGTNTISNSYATGTVSGNNYVGGLVGGQYVYSNGYVTISNSYSTGTVSGTQYVGGLVVYQSSNSSSDVTVSNSYYDKETSGQSDTGKGDGKTTADMQSEEFANDLNAFATVYSMNKWIYSIGKYPSLSNEIAVFNFSSGSGSESDPYIITTKEELKYFSLLVNTGTTFSGEYIELGNDIALNDTTGWQNWETNPPDYEWTAIGTSSTNSFQGIFDGNGYIVSGIYINTTASYQGLFGYTYNASIKNLGVEAFYIKGGSYYVGGLVGYQNSGAISNSYATGAVSGTGGSFGGLVGYQSGGTISNSYATGTVSGTSSVGGLVGSQSVGTISNSYATGTVSGTSSVGGLVGYQSSNSSSGVTVSNSYATGTVSGTQYVGGLVGMQNIWSGTITISNSYYDSQTSGQSDTGKGDGKTTAYMQSEEFANDLNVFAAVYSMNKWIYSIGKYPSCFPQCDTLLTFYYTICIPCRKVVAAPCSF